MKRNGIINSYLGSISIGTRISLCIVLVVALPLIILGTIFSKPLYNMVTASTIRDEQNALYSMVPEINTQVDGILDDMDTITSHSFFKRMFYAEIDVPFEELALSDEAYDFSDMVEKLIATTSVNAVKIYVKTPPGVDILSLPGKHNIVRPESEILGTYWHGIFNGTRYAKLHCPSYYLSKNEIESYGDSAYIIRANAYHDGEVYPSYIAVYYDSSVYGKVLLNSNTAYGSVSYIINDRNAVVCTTDVALSGTYRVKYGDIEKSLLASNNFVEREIAGLSVYVAAFQVESTDWFVVNVIPKQGVIDVADGMMLRILTVFLACFLVALVIAIVLSRSVTNRIRAVAAQMSTVHDGPPVPMEESGANDEIGKLVKTYNYMTREMVEMMKKQEETAKELRVAEFNALQAQINPHFLYNTMDMINWMALQGKNKEVSEVVQNLSRFYKLTLSRKKDYSTIADELAHARVYIELQNMRFNDGIEFVEDVPDELTVCRLPRLTFQPILENAILHGILETESKSGTIVLTIWAENDDINILISDDGAGMDEETRSQILSEERVKPTNSRGANVAVVNIHRRLQLLYGERYGLKYESAKGRGCDVTIRIPRHVGDGPYVKK